MALERFKLLGLNVNFGKNINETDVFDSSPIKARIDDLHDAFADKNVKGIITFLGGLTANQLLDHIDFDLIKNNPKVLCGFSDITALQNAIYAKTGLLTYSGPHFSCFGMKKGFEYTMKYFEKCLMKNEPFSVEDSPTWSDDTWFLDQEDRTFINNDGIKVLQEGKAKGTILGGNLCTFNLLQGTEYMPRFKQTILFLEDVDKMGSYSAEFDRNLQSLIHSEDFSEVKAIVIGRAPKKSDLTEEKIRYTFESKKDLKNMPIIYNVDFGHTTPYFTFPIGGEVEIDTDRDRPIKFINHIS